MIMQNIQVNCIEVMELPQENEVIRLLQSAKNSAMDIENPDIAIPMAAKIRDIADGLKKQLEESNA